jgi:hypothetical protein
MGHQSPWGVHLFDHDGGELLQTISFSSQGNAYAHPEVLIQGSSGILYGTTGEPNPAYYDLGSVFSLDAGLPPPR